MIYYLFVVIIIIYLVITAYIKIRYRFWSSQPAFHIYDALYWLKPPGIIKHDMPIENRYVNKKDIVTYEVGQLSEKLRKKGTVFLQTNYLNRKDIKFIPKEENIFPYFSNLEGKSYLSMFYGDGEIALKETLVAFITSRPVTIKLRNNTFTTFLVDFMCVAKNYRRKGIGEQMIQTHLYQQVKKHPDITTCFFKRETDLTLIVPLVIYKTYCYDFKGWDLKKINGAYDILKITPQTFNLFIYFLSEMSFKFDCNVVPSTSNLLDLVKTENYKIYVILENKQVVANYVFKHAATQFNKKEAVNCIASIKGNCSKEIFIYGFSHVLSLLEYEILILEDLADNNILQEAISEKHKPMFISPAAYYFHNYADRPVEKEKSCLLI